MIEYSVCYETTQGAWGQHPLYAEVDDEGNMKVAGPGGEFAIDISGGITQISDEPPMGEFEATNSAGNFTAYIDDESPKGTVHILEHGVEELSMDWAGLGRVVGVRFSPSGQYVILLNDSEDIRRNFEVILLVG